MKNLKLIGNIFKWIIIVLILIFALSLFLWKQYAQAFIFIIVALSMAYWPKYFKTKYDKKTSLVLRVIFIVLLIVINFTVFKSEPQTNIYISDDLKRELYQIYDSETERWPENTEDIYIDTEYGKVHVLACGSKENPPLMMMHAASMGAHSWADNLAPLLDHYRIYSIDNIGEGNKSELKDIKVFPKSQKEIADLYLFISERLNIEKSPVLGASNGGYIAMCYAIYYPEKVESLALFGPMGLTQLTAGSIIMLSVPTLFPTQGVRNRVITWALGTDDQVIDQYADWFNCILKGTIPSIAQPIPMTKEQKNKMDIPVILYLGTKDKIVGNADLAKEKASDFPNIQTEILESGHLIAAEHYKLVNEELIKFLKLN